MAKQKKISRRDWLKLLASLFTFSGFGLWGSAGKRKLSVKNKKTISLPKNLNDGITFFDKIIVHKKEKNIEAFSSTCTHLGCKLSEIKDDKIICPCHGSQFSFNGETEKGPAVKPLKKINIKMDKKGNLLVDV